MADIFHLFSTKTYKTLCDTLDPPTWVPNDEYRKIGSVIDDGVSYDKYTSVWDVTAMDYATEYEKQYGEPIDNKYFCTERLSMDAKMGAGETSQYDFVAGVFGNDPANDSWLTTLRKDIKYPYTTFNAQVLGIDFYEVKPDGSKTFSGAYNRYYLANFFYVRK